MVDKIVIDVLLLVLVVIIIGGFIFTLVVMYNKYYSKVPPKVPPKVAPKVEPEDEPIPVFIVIAEQTIATPINQPTSPEIAKEKAVTANAAAVSSVATTTATKKTVDSIIPLTNSVTAVQNDAKQVLELAETPAQIAAAKQVIKDAADAAAALKVTTAAAVAAKIASIKTSYSIVKLNVADQAERLESVKQSQGGFNSATNQYNNNAKSIISTLPSAISGNLMVSEVSIDNLKRLNNRISGNLAKVNVLLKQSNETYASLSSPSMVQLITYYSKDYADYNQNQLFGGHYYPPPNNPTIEYTKALENASIDAKIILDESSITMVTNQSNSLTTELSAINASLVTANGTPVLTTPDLWAPVQQVVSDLTKATGNTGQLNDAINWSISATNYTETISTHFTTLTSVDKTIQDSILALQKLSASELTSAEITQSMLTNALKSSEGYLKDGQVIKTSVDATLQTYQTSTLTELRTSINNMYKSYNELNARVYNGDVNKLISYINDNHKLILGVIGDYDQTAPGTLEGNRGAGDIIVMNLISF